MWKSNVVNNDFLAWFLIGWLMGMLPAIQKPDVKLLINDMEFHLSPWLIGQSYDYVYGIWQYKELDIICYLKVIYMKNPGGLYQKMNEHQNKSVD